MPDCRSQGSGFADVPPGSDLEVIRLRSRVSELEETLRAIREGEVDALVVTGQAGKKIYTLQGADHPYRVLVEGMNEGAVTFNDAGYILYCNRRFGEMLGRPTELLIGTAIAALFRETEYPRFAAILKTSLSGNMGAGEASFIKACGMDLPVHLSISHLEIEHLPVSCMVLTDLTAIKNAEESLRRSHEDLEIRVSERTTDLSRSNAELEQFAYVASHDLQEPLRKVANFVQLLGAKNKELSPESSRYIDLVLENVARMKELIQDLLAFSGVTRADVGIEIVDLNEVVAQILRDFNDTIELKHATVTTVLLPSITASRFHMHQLFQNLLGNALKFSDVRSPLIDISVEERDGWTFCVRDNGIGIEQTYLSQIFKVFQRLHAKHQYPGTGIGLAICQRVVHQYGGRIWAESGPGDGSRFYFTLPATA